MTEKPSLLFVNQHYWPDLAATGQMLTDLAEYLAVCGYDVSVLCSSGRYTGGGKLEAVTRERRKGVEILRQKGTGFGRSTHWGRLVDYATFFVRSLARVLRGRKFDLVVFLTTPSLVAVVGRLGSMLRNQPYAIWSMDVHPDVEERLGILPAGPVGRFFHGLSRSSYRNAEFVVVLGECMKNVIRGKGVAEEHIHTIPVWGRRDQIEPVPKPANPFVTDLGLEDRFVVMYSGNAGLAHRFDEVLGAIERMNGEADRDLEWVFVGNGPRKQEIVERVGEKWNVRYLDYWPREALKYSLSLADVHLVTMREDMAGLVVPNKLYGIMAAGRPVVMVGPGRSETARVVEREEVGYVVDPVVHGSATVERLVEVIRQLRDDDERRKRMGSRAREAFLLHYERNVACAQWEELLREELGVRVPEPSSPKTERK